MLRTAVHPACLLLALLPLGLAGGCATRTTTAVTATAAIPPAEALRAADARLASGCLDCLAEAQQTYARLASDPRLGPAAARAAFEAALLTAMREREIGLDDTASRESARALLPRLPASDRELLEVTAELAEVLPAGNPGGALTSDGDLLRRAAALQRRDAFRTGLSGHADDSPLLAYAWLSLHCAYRTADEPAVEELLAHAPRWRASPLLAFRAATCRGSDLAVLRDLLDGEPRFQEVQYFAGRHAVLEGDVDGGIAAWEQALAWRPRWPTLSLGLAEAYLGIDEYEQALTYYERALAGSSRAPAALLGAARALTYLGQHQEALSSLDELLDLNGWYVGDARYWRALNETQLEQYDAAWEDIERAAALIVGADVSKLAGIIAHRRGEPDVARSRFEEAWRRNPADCEVGVHLSIVQSGLRAWNDALAALGRTATCLDNAERQLVEELDRLRSGGDMPRQARAIADREERLATGRRLLATVWFNSAVASYYSARMEDARTFAERVLADEEFGVPARTLLGRLP